MRDVARKRWGVAFLLATAGVCLTAVLAIACGLGGSDGIEPPSAGAQATPTAVVAPEEALRLYVQRRLNQGFVAECEEARRPDDVGKQCARLRGARDNLRAYELGPTFGEYTRLLILEQVGDTWTIVHLERRDPGQPPVPGIPWPLRLGATIVVTVAEDCLQSRERPGLQAGPVACLENGTVATISAGPVEIDELQWWELEGYGWSASNWLRYPEEAGPTPPSAEE